MRVAECVRALCLAAVVVQWCSGAMVPMSDDVLGLMAFKAGLQDPNGALHSWREDDPSPCSWIGISCDNTTGRLVFHSKPGSPL